MCQCTLELCDGLAPISASPSHHCKIRCNDNDMKQKVVQFISIDTLLWELDKDIFSENNIIPPTVESIATDTQPCVQLLQLIHQNIPTETVYTSTVRNQIIPSISIIITVNNQIHLTHLQTAIFSESTHTTQKDLHFSPFSRLSVRLSLLSVFFLLFTKNNRYEI